MAPLNMVPLDKFGQQPAQPAQQPAQQPAARGNVAAALAYVYRDAITRIARRAERDVADAARKFLARDDGDGFRTWLDRFAFDVKAYAERALEPVALAHVEACGLRMKDPRRKVGQWVGRWLRWELEWIRETVDGARTAGIDPVEAIDDQAKHYEERIGEWAQEIALVIADETEED